ncbi:host attachment family protein [Sphingopyxis sp.]|jgi:protein required for attachment to host cells|uniref:host attachment family protein n=1 Tax=Sphingopyxis sp. TaxID=1908224 RepID=UPI0025EEDFFA|nr:host attachment family protein [Sphingopyxis sp.]MBK6413096.1 host attachment protein [Sphingopyxis sp.]
MQLPSGSHVAVADGTQFQLFRNSGTEQEPSLKAVDLPTSDESAHNAGQGDSPRQNEEAGHAASVASALNAAVLSNKIKDLVVIADPSTLGEMRKQYHKSLEAALVGEIAKTLTSQSTDDILKSIANA